MSNRQTQGTIMSTENEILTPEQCAERIGVKPGTLAAWRITGRYGLPYLKCGGLVRYKVEDVDAWLDSRRATRTGETATADDREKG